MLGPSRFETIPAVTLAVVDVDRVGSATSGRVRMVSTAAVETAVRARTLLELSPTHTAAVPLDTQTRDCSPTHAALGLEMTCRRPS